MDTTEAGASAAEGSNSKSPKGFLDLPAEAIGLIFENASYHDLAQLCRVSKWVRELAAAELYHDLNHTFIEDPVSSTLSKDYLAGFLETLATSDYNYAAHLKDVYVDTGYAASKGEQACRQFGYDLTCGKFLNTLLLAALKRTSGLESFYWNARIELSTAVFLQLHRMPNLRRLHLRTPVGRSMHSLPKTPIPLPPAGLSIPTSSPISPGPPPPPGPHSPGAYGYSPPTQLSNTFRMVPKLPVAKLVNQPRSFSGFKDLKTLAALEMDTLDFVPELAQCVRNSLETIKQVELSISDTLARRARDRPRIGASDGATSDDASTILSQTLPPPEETNHSGTDPQQTRQWHKAKHEAMIAGIFGPKEPDAKSAELEKTINRVVARAEGGRLPSESLFHDPSKDAEFVRTMQGIFRKANEGVSGSSKLKVFDLIEKATRKYLDNKPKTSFEKTKPKKSSVIKIKPPKPPPPVSSWAIPPQNKPSVHEDTVLEYFGFGKLTWDNMTVVTKQQYLDTYFKETLGVGFQPYPMPPPPPGKSTNYNKIYYANPGGGPTYMSGASKYVVFPPKKAKKLQPKPKYPSDSDDGGKEIIVKPKVVPEPLFTESLESPKEKKDTDDLSDDADLIYPSDVEDEGPDQEFGSEVEDDEEKDLELETIKEKINGVLKESGILDVEPSMDKGKGKEVVRNPPNGHLTPPKPVGDLPELGKKSDETETATEAVKAEPEIDAEDPVGKYLRSSHGLPIERLAIYLIPIKPTIFIQYFDPYALKSLTLLNVGSQRRIWATLTKIQRQSPLPLISLYTDNVSPALLTFLESMEANQLEDLFLLERYLRQKGRVPQLQDCDKTSVNINAIRRQILKRHIKSLRRLMIRNDDTDHWALNNATMRLIARDGAKLQELAVQCETVTFHTIVRSLPHLPSLTALQISFLIDAGTPPVSMTGVHVPPPTHHAHPHHYGPGSGGMIEPHSAASATMLHELRQGIIDSISFARETTHLEWVGFSWVVSANQGRGRSLDPEGNPHVFLTRLVPQWTASDAGAGSGRDTGSETGSDSDLDNDGDEWPTALGGESENIFPTSSSGSKTTEFPSWDPSSAASAAAAAAADKGKGKQKVLDIEQAPAEADKDKDAATNTTGPAAAAAKDKIGRDRKRDPGLSWFWAENDLNVGDVQGVRMWEKEVWSGRL